MRRFCMLDYMKAEKSERSWRANAGGAAVRLTGCQCTQWGAAAGRGRYADEKLRIVLACCA